MDCKSLTEKYLLKLPTYSLQSVFYWAWKKALTFFKYKIHELIEHSLHMTSLEPIRHGFEIYNRPTISIHYLLIKWELINCATNRISVCLCKNLDLVNVLYNATNY